MNQRIRKESRIACCGSVMTMLLGIIHILATNIVYHSGFEQLPPDKGLVFLYMFGATGFGLIFAGGIAAYCAVALGRGEKTVFPILFAAGGFVSVVGLGAVCMMPHNPFSYLTLSAAVIILSTLLTIRKSLGNKGAYDSKIVDSFLPRYHFSEQHTILINGSADVVFKMLTQFDIRHSKIIRILVTLRNLYGHLFSNSSPKQQIQLGSLFEMTEKTGFIRLAEISGREILFGGAGRFWMPAGRFVPFQTPADFINFKVKNYCKTVWSFFVAEHPDGTTTLSTETRVCCLGWAKLFFPPYWLIVRLFSAWIRMEMLRLVKEHTELYYKRRV